MAFDKKTQEIFQWYVTTYKNSEDKNFYNLTHKLDKRVKELSPSMNSAIFIARVFDELEYPKTALWLPEYEDLLLFFDSLPPRVWVDKWSIMIIHLKREDWGRYNKKYAKASFIESLGTDYLMLMEEDKKKNLIFSVFLGDIKSRVGVSDKDLHQRYNETYDAIEQEIGREAIAKLLPEDIAVIDWPNASVLQNAKYEFLIKAQTDPAIANIQNKITLALNRLGL